MIWLVVVVLLLSAAVIGGCGESDSQTQPSDRTPPAAAAQPSVEATQLEQDLPALTTAEAANDSKRIALVRSQGSRVVEGQPGTPFTQTRFRVESVLKGRLDDRIVLQVIGGRLGDVRLESPIRPFVDGRRYILFFGPDGHVGPTITPQVRFDVRRAGATDVVTPALQGIRTLVAGSARPAAALPQGGHRLKDVLFSIREYVRAKRAGP